MKIDSVIQTIQTNCHIADARHAGDYTLCVYLLKMREMYRWEQGVDFHTVLTTDDVGDWLTEREGEWDDYEEQEYQSIVVDGVEIDPFDNAAMNQLLNPFGYVYSAGYGNRCRPHFFIGELDKTEVDDGVSLFVSAKEFARDMASPPAMMQGNMIFIRKESLRRMLWEKVEEWRWSPLDNAMGRVVSFYDFEKNPEQALDEMLYKELPFVVKHEKGEVKAGGVLGEQWEVMLNALVATRAEIMLRAIRDHLADTLCLLEELFQQSNEVSIHFYFGNMTAMRKSLAPTYVAAYQHWCDTGDLSSLQVLKDTASKHWEGLALEALSLFEKGGKQAAEQIEALVDSSHF